MKLLRSLAFAVLFLLEAVVAGNAAKIEGGTLWRAADDTGARDLYYGPGGEKHRPQEPFTFIEEELADTNPKFTVQDAAGVKWTVKLGPEARPEIAATRIVWGAGYFATEDYLVHDLVVKDLPKRLHRGQHYVRPDGSLADVRLKRHLDDEKKIGSWSWRSNDFSKTREFNGLRALMALLNNWDLTDENNAIYEPASGERVFLVGDLGSTLGNGRLSWPVEKGRGDLDGYVHSKFIRGTTRESVDFRVPTRPQLFYLFTPREYFSKVKLRWIGQEIPRSDAHWMGEQLARLSSHQLNEAFRAAGYSSSEAEQFVAVIQKRIAELQGL